MSSAVDLFVAYQFVKVLSTPWEETDAYKLGIIDKNGNILKKRRTLRTNDEKKAYTIFHTLVWNVKRLLDKLPLGRTRLGSFAASLWLLKEHHEVSYGIDHFNLQPTIDALAQYLSENHNLYSADNMFMDLYEAEGEDVLRSGSYTLRVDVDTPLGIFKAGQKIRVDSDIPSFDTVAGEPVFRVRTDGKDLVVSKSSLMQDGEPLEESETMTKVEKFVDEYVSGNNSRLKTLQRMATNPRLGKEIQKALIDADASYDVYVQIFQVSEDDATFGNMTPNIDANDPQKASLIGATVARRMDEDRDAFAGIPVFNVSSETFMQFQKGKVPAHRWSKYLNMDEDECCSMYEYAKSNPGAKMIVRNPSGAMFYVRPDKR
jgi:hypothetical protein